MQMKSPVRFYDKYDLNREIIVRPIHQRIMIWLWAWFLHPFKYLFNSNYRKWYRIKWKPELVQITPTLRHNAGTLRVQPMYKRGPDPLIVTQEIDNSDKPE